MSNKLVDSACRLVKIGSLKLKKHAPEILIGVGIVGSVASTVLACKATIKAQPVIDKAKKSLDDIHEADNNPRISYEDYSKEQVKKDIVHVYAKTGAELAKVYGPSIVIGAASMGCMIGSHAMVNKRLNNVVAAYTALGESFRQYKKNVEKQLKDAGIKQELPASSEDAHTIEVEDKRTYTFIFDKNNPNWKDNIDYNLTFLRSCETYLDCLLKRDGVLFANDANKELGFDLSPNGQLDGWMYDFDHPDKYGDGYVSFGLVKDGIKSDSLVAYESGETDYLVLTYNIDGVVYDRI